MSPAFAIAGAALASLLGWRARALTGGGALAAWGVGALVLAGTGWPGGLALGAFFVGSSAISRVTEARQPAWLDAKGNRRDAWQVLANGAVAALGGALALRQPAAGAMVVVAALAAAAADTWATSIGALSGADPVDLVRWTRVPRGTSGGVSLIGSAGGVLGAGLVGVVPVVVGWPAAAAAAAALIGTIGMLTDSLLGATVQGRFACPACGVASERRRHRCGTPNRPVGGWTWLGNDGVNFWATAFAGLLGWGWWLCCWP